MKNTIDIKKQECKKIMSENLIKIVSKGADIRTISISEIIKDSGVSRSNFYNYFSDIYALLKWTYDQELTLQFDDMHPYADKMQFSFLLLSLDYLLHLKRF